VVDTVTKLLQRLPPETAHGITLKALEWGLGPRAPADDPRLKTVLFGKAFANPIGLAAGAEKKARALRGWARMGFGFVEAGTVTLRARAGNPKPRIWRMEGGNLVNWMGLPGDGLEPFVKNLKAFSGTEERKTLALGASLASPDGALDEFRALSAACAPLVDYLTLNASCPNVAGHASGPDPAQSAREQVKAVVAEAGGKPVLLKLGPTRDREALKIMLDAAMASGAAGIVATNTAPFDKRAALSATPASWPQSGGKEVGGWSGPLLLDTACWMVGEARALLGKDVPIMGGGGIQSGADALRMMKAGANAVQLYTGLAYKGPGLLAEITRDLLKTENTLVRAAKCAGPPQERGFSRTGAQRTGGT
jgi:dihydroorotate dehydrogenase